jgi:DNA polymerase I-like protein with 3'-5' exonuclease and polymerase domains
MSLFLEWPTWTLPAEMPPQDDTVALDWEALDPLLKSHGPSWSYRGRGEGVGLSLATATTSTYYPLRHEDSNIENPEALFRWLREFVSKPDNTLVMFNALYDLGWLARDGIEVRCKIADPGAAIALLDENRMSYSLDACSKTYLKAEKIDLRPLSDQLGIPNIWDKIKRLHPALIQQYAARDARLTYDLWKAIKPSLEVQGLMPIFQLEMELVPVLLKMRLRGVRVDVARAEQEERRLLAEKKDIIAQLKHVTGLTVDLWSSGSVEGALLEAGIKPPRTDAGAASITAGWLEGLDHDVPRLILRGRRTDKLAGTFVRNYFLDHQIDGRVHANFSPLRSDAGGAVTGRFSCSGPNLQNLSARNPESAKIVRGLCLPEEGQLWASSDWSSQEPRLTVHFAAEVNKWDSRRCGGAQEIIEEYRRNPRTDFHQWVANLTGLTRKKAKDINLGLAYGMGEAKLCNSLGVPTVTNDRGREVAGPEGKEILRQYYERMGFMRDLQNFATEQAERRGFIKTLLGRRRRFLQLGEQPMKNDRRAFAYKALNALIQGSAADQMKKAMIECDRAGLTILVTLHDELAFSVKDETEAKRATEIMCECVPLAVPMVVDLAIGKNWGEAM